MKVAQIGRFGGPEVFEIIDAPTPTPAAGEVLVRVGAAGINFAETLMRENRYALTPPLPSVLGSEVAGTIAGLGRGVSGPAVGTRVAAPLFATGTFFGGYADYVTIDARFVAPLPEALSFEDATALMVQGLTALHLTRQAPPAGKTVLVNAAAGGVGSLLVQLAKRAGAGKVIAAASTSEKLELTRSLGADNGIDYTRGDWIETLRAVTEGAGPDVIYESVGGAVTTASLEALAPRGTLVIYGALNIQGFQIGVPELLGLIFNNQSVTGFALVPLLSAESLRADLTDLFDLAVRGALEVTVGGTYPLERVAEAHRALEQRSTSGKLALIP